MKAQLTPIVAVTMRPSLTPGRWQQPTATCTGTALDQMSPGGNARGTAMGHTVVMMYVRVWSSLP